VALAADTSFASTKVQLVLTAERLFATHGIDGASLRQVAFEAKCANTSAVQYHFGSREGLADAILRFRLPLLIQRRAQLLDRADPSDLMSSLEAYLLPILEQAEAEGSYYLSFVQQFLGMGLGENPFYRLPAELQAPRTIFVARVAARLPEIPEPIRSERVRDVIAMFLHAAADRERALRACASVAPFDLQAGQLVDGLLGYLKAPVSEATLRALARAESRQAPDGESTDRTHQEEQ